MNKKNKIVKLVTAIHSPFDTRIFHKEAKTLNKNGYKVSIIVPHTHNEIKEGIEIIAVKKPKNGKEQLLTTPFLILKKAFKEPKDSIFHIHDSELLLIGILLKLSGRKVIYDAHEDTPLQISYQHWIPNFLKKPYSLYYKLLEFISGKIFNAIIVAEPIISRYYPSKKVILLRNFPFISSFDNHKYIPYDKREKRLIYVGLMSVPRGAREMTNAANLANKVTPFSFIIGGKFSPKSLEDEILTISENINFIGWLSMSELIDQMLLSKIGIIIPTPNDRYKTNYPVKMFEYMAAGLPVIASKRGISSEFIKESDSGILVDPLDEIEISKAISFLLENPELAKRKGENGKKMVFEKYNWEHESAKLIELYSSLTK